MIQHADDMLTTLSSTAHDKRGFSRGISMITQSGYLFCKITASWPTEQYRHLISTARARHMRGRRGVSLPPRSETTTPPATSNKCIATSNNGITSNKKLLYSRILSSDHPPSNLAAEPGSGPFDCREFVWFDGPKPSF